MKKSKASRRKSAAKSSRAGKNQAAPKKATKRSQTPGKTALKKATWKSKAKTKALQTVPEYLAAVPEPSRSALNQIRAAIRSVVPAEATEIISYGIPAFKHKKVLVWYAAFANHCSLFPTAAVIEAFKDELKGFSQSKGTIHFPLDKAMPVELIKRMVKARVEQT
jgi:uncharacterized protein YdhG (YjbR/CyaY superfamily)